jgi:NAD(P)-dependent dehydrogenase (short-subunit alcohol dehydrogenase family)
VDNKNLTDAGGQALASKKVLLLTGGSGGLGLEIAKRLLLDGHIVCTMARSKINRQLLEDKIPSSILDANFLYTQGDVRSSADIEKFFTLSNSTFSKIDGVIHCAGVLGELGRFEELDLGKWADTVNINLFGTVNVLQASVKYFRNQRFGNFVALSGGGATSPMPRHTAYAASKVAVVRLVESVAVDNKDGDYTFNLVAPGIMATQMLDQILQSDREMVGLEYFTKMLEFKNSGKNGIPDAVDLICHLALGKAPKITGRLLSAVWDQWREISVDPEVPNHPDWFTLKRYIPEKYSQ